MSQKDHWKLLSAKQQGDLLRLRERMSAHLRTETELFYQEHPELQLTWNLTCDAFLRKHSVSDSEEGRTCSLPSQHLV